MKKNFLENHSKIMQLESRLNKNHYLSKDRIPGTADGKIFALLQKNNQIPDRKLYPNFYRWYIIIKQFSDSTRQKWINQQEDDQLIQEIIKDYGSNIIGNQMDERQNNIYSPISQPPAFHESLFKPIMNDQTKYILNITFKENITAKTQEIIKEIQKYKVKITNYHIDQNGHDLVINFIADQNECQQLKNKMAKWPEIEKINFRQHKKVQHKARTTFQQQD